MHTFWLPIIATIFLFAFIVATVSSYEFTNVQLCSIWIFHNFPILYVVEPFPQTILYVSIDLHVVVTLFNDTFLHEIESIVNLTLFTSA